MKHLELGCRANVFVPPHAPQYQAMLDLAAHQNADPLDFKYAENGIWVTLKWLDPSDRTRPYQRRRSAA